MYQVYLDGELLPVAPAKLTVKPLADMRLDLVVDEDTGESYDYTSSIDGDTYNKIKLAVDNSETGERETYVLNEPENQARWGQLQYYEKLDADTSDTVLAEKAKVLLQYYNKKTRSLQIKGVFGDVRVRGGSLLVIKMGLGDMDVQNYMCVEKVLHQFYSGKRSGGREACGILQTGAGAPDIGGAFAG